MTKTQLMAKIERLAVVSARMESNPNASVRTILSSEYISLFAEIERQVEVMYQGADEDEKFGAVEPPHGMEVPYGSVAFHCPKCERWSLSAGDGCNNCGYGYVDEDDEITDEEVSAFFEAMADAEYHGGDILDVIDARYE